MSCRQLQEDQRGLESLFRVVINLLEEESGWSGGMHDKFLKAGRLLGETYYQALVIVRDVDFERV